MNFLQTKYIVKRRKTKTLIKHGYTDTPQFSLLPQY